MVLNDYEGRNINDGVGAQSNDNNNDDGEDVEDDDGEDGNDDEDDGDGDVHPLPPFLHWLHLNQIHHCTETFDISRKR